MKSVVMVSVIAISLMATTILFYKEGYKDGKENKYDA